MKVEYFILKSALQVVAGSAPVSVGEGLNWFSEGSEKQDGPPPVQPQPFGTKLSLFDGDLMVLYEMKVVEACMAVVFAFTAC